MKNHRTTKSSFAKSSFAKSSFAKSSFAKNTLAKIVAKCGIYTWGLSLFHAQLNADTPLEVSVQTSDPTSSLNMDVTGHDTVLEQAQIHQKLSLEEAIQRLKQRPQYLREALLQQSTETSTLSQLSPYRPQLNVQINAGKRRDAIGLNNPFGNSEFSQIQTEASQFIYGFGIKDAVMKGIHATTEGANRSMEWNRVQLEYQLRLLFTQSILLQEELKTLSAAVVWTKNEYQVTQSSFKAGVASKLTLYRTEQEHNRAKSRKLQRERQLYSLHQQLQAILGERISAQGSLTTLESKNIFNLSPSNDSKGLEVSLLRHAIELSRQTTRGYRLSHRPELHGFVSSQQGGDQWHGGQTDHDWRAGLQLKWTIDSSLRLKQLSQAQELQTLSLEEDLKTLIEQRSSLREYLILSEQQIQKEISILKDTVTQAQTSYEITLSMYKNGTITHPRLEETRYLLSQSQLDLSQAHYEYQRLVHESWRWKQ